MRVFGAVCYAYEQNPKKLEPRSKEGIFVGYDKNSPAYLVYFPENMKVERVRCVKFFDSPEFEDIGKNGQVEDEIDTITRVTPHIEQQNATDNDEKSATHQWGM